MKRAVSCFFFLGPLIFLGSVSAKRRTICQSLLAEMKLEKESHTSTEQDNDWKFDGFIAQDYNSYFNPLLRQSNAQSFEDLAKIRRARGAKTHTLEIAGSAIFSDSPENFDSLTGFRLGPRTTEDSNFVKGPSFSYEKREEVYGSVFETPAWNKLKQNMKARAIDGFDIVIARPLGPLWHMEEFSVTDVKPLQMVTKRVLDQIWSVTSADKGQIFLQVPLNFQNLPAFEKWLSTLASQGIPHSVTWNHNGGMLVLTKTHEGPIL